MRASVSQIKWRRLGEIPWPFFTLAYGVLWNFWIPAAMSGREATTIPVMLLIALGGIGPALAGVLLTHLAHDQDGQHDYWRRVIEFGRIGAGMVCRDPTHGATEDRSRFLAGLPSRPNQNSVLTFSLADANEDLTPETE